MSFIPNLQSAKILQPSIQALDFPAPAIAAQGSTILSRRLDPIQAMRRNQFNAALSQLRIQRITIVGRIPDQAVRDGQDKSRCESCFHKGDLMRRSTRNVNGERKTSAVCHCHDLCTFAALGLSHSASPFLATTKVPSIKHSDKSSLPRWRKSSARVSKMCWMTPACRHSWKRRWQVWYGGYRSGKSRQAAPVRKIHKIPFSTSRFSRRGRPLPSARLTGCGINGFKIIHCSSVKSIATAPIYDLETVIPFLR